MRNLRPSGKAHWSARARFVKREPLVGGAGTGFGGTAPHGPGSPLPWLAVIGTGALLTLGGGLGWRRAMLARLTAAR